MGPYLGLISKIKVIVFLAEEETSPYTIVYLVASICCFAAALAYAILYICVADITIIMENDSIVIRNHHYTNWKTD